MREKIKAFFTDNLGWKLVSLLAGLVIWAAITNTQDPVQSKIVNVPITYKNADQLLAEENLVFMSGPETMQINVQAKNSNLASVTAGLFRCEADLMDHSGGDITNQRVHVTVTEISGLDIVHDWSYARNNPNVTVVMDEQISRDFGIELHAEDSLTEGLILEGSVEFTPAYVTVTGPKTKFANVAAVKAPVNMKELSDEGGGKIAKPVVLQLYDANNKIISNSDHALTLEPAVSLLSATIDRLQNVYVIVSGTVGEPAEGYQYLSSSVSPSTISVQGLKSNVADFTELRIPADAIDITGISGKKDYQIDLSQYLPEGVKLSGNDGIVTVTIEVESVVSRIFRITAEDIRIYGDEGLYDYFLRDIDVEVEVTGFEEDLDLFQVSSLAPTIDVTDLTEGYHNVPVLVSSVPGYRIENKDSLRTSVNVRLKEKPTPPESSSEEETEPGESGSEEDTESLSEPVSESEKETETESIAEEETGVSSGEQP
ncbi:MAG: hypothetical protein IKI54_02705 [Lachnospiraceae bacterium]|nr:hypothetical protein [Lachnospiraceae bacterium]